jgi:D-glycero-D-manno-heptose 1,7-bisphosphate phosphatase
MFDWKLIILDVDGTLVTTASGATFRKTADDWQWLPGRIDRLNALRQQGVTLALATNQGGVAFGYMEEPDMTAEIQKVAFQIDAQMWHICYDHPKATIERYRHESQDRKPGPGMLLNIMETLKIGPGDTLMVGDRPEDEQAAQAAGTAFMWANEFFDVKQKEGVDQ